MRSQHKSITTRNLFFTNNALHESHKFTYYMYIVKCKQEALKVSKYSVTVLKNYKRIQS